jgi:hypothetical protein
MTAKGNRIGGPPVAEPVYVYPPPYYWGPRYYFSYGWWQKAPIGEACNGSYFFVPATRSEHRSLAALSEIVVDCAIASGLGTIGEPIIEISQAHNCSGGIIVFQFFRRHAHLCGALAKMN